MRFWNMQMKCLCKMSDSETKIFQSVFSSQNKALAITKLQKCIQTLKWFSPKSYAVKAGLLIPLCWNLQNQPCFLLTLRSSKLSKHKGEISFPGGVSEPSDKDCMITTALRESYEEIGIDLSQKIDIWTSLRPMPTLSPDMGVTPVVGLINEPIDPTKFPINTDEVEHVFALPFQYLCNQETWGKVYYGRGLALPVFLLNVKDNSSGSFEPLGKKDVNLWGLTGVLSHLCLEALLPPTTYNRKIQLDEPK